MPSAKRSYGTWLARTHVDMVTFEGPTPEASAWAVDGDWLFLFIGSTSALVQDIALAFLAGRGMGRGGR